MPPFFVSIFIFTGTCPSGWEEFDGQCYKFVDKTPTWDEALQECLSIGATLASITNKATNDFLLTIATKWSMVGGHHLTDGTWAWTDGSPWNFTNWAPGEPNNQNERWLWMGGPDAGGRAGKWNDGGQSWTAGTYGYICQKEPGKIHNRAELILKQDRPVMRLLLNQQ